MRARAPLLIGFIALAQLRCFSTSGLTSGDATTPDAATDAPSAAETGAPDAAVATECRDDAPFTRVRRLDELSGPTRDGTPRLLPDELTIYFQRAKNLNAPFDFDIWTAKRASRALPFDPPQVVAELATASDDSSAGLTADGLTLYFVSNRDDDAGRTHVYRTGRPVVTDPFGLVQLVPSTTGDGLATEANPFVEALGRELFYASDRDSDAGQALWSAPVVGGVVQTPSPLGFPPVTVGPVLTADGQTLYFMNVTQIAYARRNADGGFDTPQPAPGLASSATDRPGWISPDRCRLYFGRNADVQNTDLFIAERDP